ncbi:MAG: serine hydrolase domain-containing protein [Terriglobales bacterium]|jgi:CubicO group peptidase (beta-lactamase class C family)
MKSLLVCSLLVLASGLRPERALSASAQAAINTAGAQATEKLAADAPKTTVLGNAFIAPKDWSIRVEGPATILEAPEGDSWVALVDVQAKTQDEALAAAWRVYKPDSKWPLKVTNDLPDRDGWSRRRLYDYQTSPNEKRGVDAFVYYSGSNWTVVIEDVADAVAGKRGGQLALIFSRLLPKGYSRESFAGKKANTLDSAHIAELSHFVEQGQKVLGVPGVAVGVVQDGKVAFAGGFGVKKLGGTEKPDGDTLFMIASNTKAMTTLLLAKLVDEHQITWDTPVIKLFPSFRLGDAETTHSVLVRHLICACTGMPRQDLEWIFDYGKMTPESTMALLGTMQPTSKFGDLFQYSNLMAAAGGYTGAHVIHPDKELGAAYDSAIQSYVFDPLQMKETTFDFKRAFSGNHAGSHSPDADGKTAKAVTAINDAIIPARPAGGAWSSVNDMLKYVSMELAEGKLPDGTTYISKEPLLERRTPQVSIGKDVTYGMGLMVDTTYGVPVVHHGGDLVGYHSDMMWLPQQNVGLVILTNADPGWLLRDRIRRKLLEVLFDGHPEAEALLNADAKSFYADLAAERKLMTIPADANASARLAKHYTNASLGEITISASGASTIFDFGEWKSEVASRKNPDGTISFITTVPGELGFEFVVGSGARRTLTIRDAQHEYVFQER